ncbi:MAG: hypothetical protein HC767_06690, partial [Akkermansiaceae bacterium]|nr:hypothetical protein [Akkermansiaceae bacterium]
TNNLRSFFTENLGLKTLSVVPHARLRPDHAGGGRAERAGRQHLVPAEQREGADRVREAVAREVLLRLAGPGSANRLEMERFMKSSGIQMTHVPYKGGAGPAITLLLLAGLFIWLESGQLRRRALEHAGWRETGSVEAANRSEAETRLVRGLEPADS